MQQQQPASSTESSDPVSLVFETLHTWIRYVPVNAHVIKDTPLLQASIQAMTQPRYMEHGADVVVEILRMYPSHHVANEELLKKMIPLLSQLPLDDALRSDNEDVMRAYCRVVTEMGESYMSWILSSHYAQSSQLVDWVLLCSAIENVEIASITLHFWYRMVLDLEQIDPYDWRQELVDAYTPQLLRLIDLCVTSLMRFPDDFSDLPPDAVEDLKRHRYYVSDAVEDCCQLLGGHTVLKRMGSHWQNQVNKAGSSGQPLDWQGLESCLACIVAIHSYVPSDEAEVLPSCFGLIPQLPADIRPLRYTACQMIGKFGLVACKACGTVATTSALFDSGPISTRLCLCGRRCHSRAVRVLEPVQFCYCRVHVGSLRGHHVTSTWSVGTGR